MKTQETTAAVDSQISLEPVNLALLDPSDSRLIPTNKQINTFLELGYELSDFRTRSRDGAKDEAKRVREEEGKRTTYIALLGGYFSILVAPAKESEKKAEAAKAKRPAVPVSVETVDGKVLDFSSTSDLRAFARLCLEAARQADFEFDLEQAKAAKAAKTETV